MPGLKANARASANTGQVYASQGIGSPAERLPKKFQARNQVTDADPGLVTLDPPPPDHLAFAPGQPCAVVRRWPRTVGMRYLYAFGHIRMKPRRDAAGGLSHPFISQFQTMFHGPIKNAGFNDALYQAGYPGFNLGLSFAVQTPKPPNSAGTGRFPPMVAAPFAVSMSDVVNQRPGYGRPTGRSLGK